MMIPYWVITMIIKRISSMYCSIGCCRALSTGDTGSIQLVFASEVAPNQIEFQTRCAILPPLWLAACRSYIPKRCFLPPSRPSHSILTDYMYSTLRYIQTHRHPQTPTDILTQTHHHLSTHPSLPTYSPSYLLLPTLNLSLLSTSRHTL